MSSWNEYCCVLEVCRRYVHAHDTSHTYVVTGAHALKISSAFPILFLLIGLPGENYERVAAGSKPGNPDAELATAMGMDCGGLERMEKLGFRPINKSDQQ